MSSTTLSIDIDDVFLRHPAAKGGRVRRFMERAFAERQERSFDASWMRRAMSARRDGDTLVFPALDVSRFKTGDRLWLSASLDDDSAIAELYDGAALLVQHILERADPLFATDLLSEPLPEFGLTLVTEEQRRVDWMGALERAIAQAVAFEVRTVASLRALSDFMRSSGIPVAITRDLSPLASTEEGVGDAIAAETLLAQLLASERAGRTPLPGRVAPDLEAEPIAALQADRRRQFSSEFELPRLMKMISAIDEVIPLKRAPAEEALLIDTVAAGETLPERG